MAEMAAADRAAVAAGASALDLMRRAGLAVADAVEARFARGPVVVLAGPGANGGDGYIAATELRNRGWSVQVRALGVPGREDARAAAAAWGEALLEIDAEVPPEAVILDALFGAGLDRPLPPVAAHLAERLERRWTQVMAVDLPSGVHGDSGQPLDGRSFRAALTVTFHRLKPAHVLQPGRRLCGEVRVQDIGLGPTPSRLWENSPELWESLWPWPGVETHKHQRGRLLAVSGDYSHTGASRLAARAGLRIGAGLVTILAPPGALAAQVAHLEAVMLRAFDGPAALASEAQGASAVIIGPAAGVTEATRNNVRALAGLGVRLVVDADALTVFRDAPQSLFDLLQPNDVLAPHAGEFERIFPGLLSWSSSRIVATREAAVRAGAIVLLKGADTVVAAPDGRAVVNTNAPPWLATAGSGDVLAGLIGGLMAQGLPAFEAACAGAWVHGACAQAFGPGLISEDLPDLVPGVMRGLWSRVAHEDR